MAEAAGGGHASGSRLTIRLVAGGGSGEGFVRGFGGYGLNAGRRLLSEEDTVDEAGQGGTESWSQPEEPELGEGPSTDEQRRTGAARGVDGKVGDGDAHQMNEGEAEADGQRREAFGGANVSGAEDDEEEEESKDHFGHEAGLHGVAARRVRAITIAGEVAEDESGLAAGDDKEGGCSDESAEDLGNDVGQQMGDGKAAADNEAEGDSGVQVAAGDVADGVAHGEHGEAEGEGNADESDTEGGEASGEDGSAASAKDQPCGAEELG